MHSIAYKRLSWFYLHLYLIIAFIRKIIFHVTNHTISYNLLYSNLCTRVGIASYSLIFIFRFEPFIKRILNISNQRPKNNPESIIVSAAIYSIETLSKSDIISSRLSIRYQSIIESLILSFRSNHENCEWILAHKITQDFGNGSIYGSFSKKAYFRSLSLGTSSRFVYFTNKNRNCK